MKATLLFPECFWSWYSNRKARGKLTRTCTPLSAKHFRINMSDWPGGICVVEVPNVCISSRVFFQGVHCLLGYLDCVGFAISSWNLKMKAHGSGNSFRLILFFPLYLVPEEQQETGIGRKLEGSGPEIKANFPYDFFFKYPPNISKHLFLYFKLLRLFHVLRGHVLC